MSALLACEQCGRGVSQQGGMLEEILVHGSQGSRWIIPRASPWQVRGKQHFPPALPSSPGAETEGGLCQTCSCDRTTPGKPFCKNISSMAERPWLNAGKVPRSVLGQQQCPRAASPALILQPGISEMGQAQFQTPSPNALHRTGFHPQDGFQFHPHFSQIRLIPTETVPINASSYRGRRKPFLQSPRASASKRHLGRMHEWPDCVHFQEGIHMYNSASSPACAGSAPLMSNQSAAGTNA